MVEHAENKLRYLLEKNKMGRAEMLANYINAKGVKDIYRHVLIKQQNVVKVVITATELEIWVATDEPGLLHRISLVTIPPGTTI